jgi:hypothetical protein
VKKRCTQCTVVKCLGRFYADKRHSDGRMSICKCCHKANVAENYELKRDQYRERKREISARPKYVAQRAAYSRSERGRQVNRETKRFNRRFKALEMRA